MKTEEIAKGIETELSILRSLYPPLKKDGLDMKFLEKILQGQIPLPLGAERWMLLPRWESIAPSYGVAIRKNHFLLEKKSGKINYQIYSRGKDEFLSSVNEDVRSRDYLKEIARQQGNNKILIVPVQFSDYVNKEVSRVRMELDPCEFELGSFAGSVFLLCHPDYLSGNEDQWFNCSGDVDPLGKGYAPFYGCIGKNLRYGTGYIEDSHNFCGSATGFIPKF